MDARIEPTLEQRYEAEVTALPETSVFALTVAERAFARKAITKLPYWKEYAKEWKIDASALDKRRISHYCHTQAISRDMLLAGFDEAREESEATKAIDADVVAKAAEIIEPEAVWQERRKAGLDGFKEAARKQEEATIAKHLEKQNTAHKDAQAANEAFRPMAEALKPFFVPQIMAHVEAMTERLVGELPTTIIKVKRIDGSKAKLPATHHPMFPTLVKALSQPMSNGSYPNILLVGGTGTGKTHAAHQAAEAMGIPYYHMGSLSGAHELVGFIDASGRYHETPFVKAFRDGGLVLLDEVDSGDANATLAVNAALANGACEFPQIGMIKRHPDCRIVAAANTWNGPTAEFIGRNKLDGAFLSRFPIKLAWNADTAFELQIGGNESFTKRVQAARHRAGQAGLKHNIDIRHAMAGAALIACGFTEDEAAMMTYQAGLKPEQVRQVEGR